MSIMAENVTAFGGIPPSFKYLTAVAGLAELAVRNPQVLEKIIASAK